jgi:hypothetical protein
MDLGGRTNMRDFHDHLLSWVAMEPNPATLAAPTTVTSHGRAAARMN